jgi:hypothetical protein
MGLFHKTSPNPPRKSSTYPPPPHTAEMRAKCGCRVRLCFALNFSLAPIAFPILKVLYSKARESTLVIRWNNYIAASGLPNANPNHAGDLVRAAIEIRDFIDVRKKETNGATFGTHWHQFRRPCGRYRRNEEIRLRYLGRHGEHSGAYGADQCRGEINIQRPPTAW